MFTKMISLRAVTRNLINTVSDYSFSVKQVKPTWSRLFSTTSVKNDLMEFFDNEKNWGATEVRSGRSWKKDELRLKSNEDLHKLWFVLLKERNMLMTMEENAKEEAALFPSPERIDKVQDSMENLEFVVRERNEAYHYLERGETGEQPAEMRTGVFGLRYHHKMFQHLIPEYLNSKHRARFPKFREHDRDVKAFLLKYREKLYLEKRKAKHRNFNHVVGLLKRFPDMDIRALEEQYPDVDIAQAKNSRKCRGHFAPK